MLYSLVSRMAALSALFLATGCATAPPPAKLTAKQKVGVDILANVRQSCEASKEAFDAGQAQAYCTFSDTDLHFVFRSRAIYLKHALAVSNLVQAYCVAGEMRTGQWQKYSWVFEEERESYSRKCRDPKAPENPTEKQ